MKTLLLIWNHPLSLNNRGAAFSRWLRWQFGSRLLKHPVMVPWIDSSVLVVEKGMTGATGNIYCGLHEFADMGFLLHFLREGDEFADIGANIGSYSILSSFVVGAHTHAFEPLPSTFSKLLRNIAANSWMGVNRVTSYMAAVGERAGFVYFTSDRDTMNSVVGEDHNGPSTKVPVMRLDDALCHSETILWKIDVEGYEESVLLGAREQLSHVQLKAVMLETETPKIISIMESFGFEKVSYDPLKRAFSSPSLLRIDNQLWVRDRQFCEARVKESRKYMINNFWL